jgi:uncharacterized Tic20 family protein
LDVNYGDESGEQNPYVNKYATAESQKMQPGDEKTWAVMAHVLSLIGSFFFAGFIPALVIYLVTNSRGPYVRHHSAQELNFQLTIIIANLAIGALWLLSIFVWVLWAVLWIPTAAVWIVAIVIPIIGAVKAGNGEFYKLPLSINFIK